MLIWLQYGEFEMTVEEQPYVLQLSKYGSVQDRSRDWRTDVRAKINLFSCMQIAMLDIDGFWLDKGFHITTDALADCSGFQTHCSRKYDKENFLVLGELIESKFVMAVYVGRGKKQPDNYWQNSTEAFSASNAGDPEYFIRGNGYSSLGGSNFAYDT
ncbi:alpha-glucan synthase [Diplodia corticola]|uniref:Alpha-glucan synthase n=1 Tax=Diplodia corticola TaxID=236234 RepID=A0A1J9QNR7_9PEZI|nr:alpha-glucan synthase [Diplodia corticola]OJD29698.1 alpha-glucan synthase [Diplodia corticola]